MGGRVLCRAAKDLLGCLQEAFTMYQFDKMAFFPLLFSKVIKEVCADAACLMPSEPA